MPFIENHQSYSADSGLAGSCGGSVRIIQIARSRSGTSIGLSESTMGHQLGATPYESARSFSICSLSSNGRKGFVMNASAPLAAARVAISG